MPKRSPLWYSCSKRHQNLSTYDHLIQFSHESQLNHDVTWKFEAVGNDFGSFLIWVMNTRAKTDFQRLRAEGLFIYFTAFRICVNAMFGRVAG